MKILVTGATGYTGSNLSKRLIEEGHSVRALVRDLSKGVYLKNLGADIVEGDVMKPSDVDKAVNGVDIVFHLAAVFRTTGVKDSVLWDVHVQGTRNLLDAGIKYRVKRFIHCSTIGVYGHVENPPADENSPFNPGDIYQYTKLEGEKLAIKYNKEKNIPLVIIRPAGIYGPGEMRFLKLFRAVKKGLFFMIGSGNIYWHPVYIDDLINGFLLMLYKDNIFGEAFIIGGEKYITLNQLVSMIAEVMGIKLRKIHIPAKPIQILGSMCEYACKIFNIEPPLHRRRVDFFTKARAFSIEKAKAMLGYCPKVDLKEGLSKTYKWYKENGLL